MIGLKADSYLSQYRLNEKRPLAVVMVNKYLKSAGLHTARHRRFDKEWDNCVTRY